MNDDGNRGNTMRIHRAGYGSRPLLSWRLESAPDTPWPALAICVGLAAAAISAVATLGGLTFQYCLWSAFGKDIPWYGDAVAGLFLCEFTVPCAVAIWVVRLCGVVIPFF